MGYFIDKEKQRNAENVGKLYQQTDNGYWVGIKVPSSGNSKSFTFWFGVAGLVCMGIMIYNIGTVLSLYFGLVAIFNLFISYVCSEAWKLERKEFTQKKEGLDAVVELINLSNSKTKEEIEEFIAGLFEKNIDKP